MSKSDLSPLLDDVLRAAKNFGADAADVLASSTQSVSVTRRMGRQESLVRSEDFEIGLRVFVGKSQAIVSSSERSVKALSDMAARAVAMAKAAPADPFARLALPEELANIKAQNIAALDLYDNTVWDVAAMNDMADRMEQAALATKGITNSEGATVGQGHDYFHFAASNGFSAGYASSAYHLSMAAIAGADDQMQVDHDGASASHAGDLPSAEQIGKNAAERACAALNPRKIGTATVPVIFDRRIAGGVISSLASAISGGLVARGTTLLKDKLGQKVFAKGITITDDPFLKRGPRSHPFDAEGLLPQRRAMIDSGILTGWFLDLSSAAQLKLKSTGNAARGASSGPSPRPANLTLQAGSASPQDFIAEIKQGFFVKELMGQGANLVTGDYSRGARGFWIENGKIAYPVSEVTIAGNILDMWAGLQPANDLKIEYGIDSPTLLLPPMMVAGS